ncbi:uncharacterized protein LOC132787622 [Drosophila nasuta]|uniref:uncharacterized protein LOC132787622 n=1 Tax=Drosophila nasuta TaxID=42062 RepID=UPI00295EE98F|nr:uncharacterized protein LOC132787622 [Drosophila nasuta]
MALKHSQLWGEQQAAAVVALSIDPIAATQFSISNATVTSSPSASPSSLVPGKTRAGALKRNNSYRLANDELKLEMNKENFGGSALPSALPLQHATSSLKLRNHNKLQLLHSPNSSNNSSAKIAKSFERLVDEFSLSTTCIDSSYLRNKSLENFDDSAALMERELKLQPDNVIAPDNDVQSAPVNNSEEDEAEEEEEDDEEMLSTTTTPHQRYHKSFVESVLLRPFKIILPNEDNGARRQRILQKFEVTEIW